MDLESLDLSSWRVAFSGAEPVRPRTIEAFSERFASAGFRRSAFYPCYGLAEATLFVSGGRSDRGPVIRDFDRAARKRVMARLAMTLRRVWWPAATAGTAR